MDSYVIITFVSVLFFIISLYKYTPLMISQLICYVIHNGINVLLHSVIHDIRSTNIRHRLCIAITIVFRSLQCCSFQYRSFQFRSFQCRSFQFRCYQCRCFQCCSFQGRSLRGSAALFRFSVFGSLLACTLHSIQ